MDAYELEQMVASLRDGTMSADDALVTLRRLPFADLGFARVDHHRHLRQGLPEAVYAPGKSAQQCADIVAELIAHGRGPVLLTRADAEQVAAALRACPGGVVTTTGSSATPLSLVTWRASAAREEVVVVVTAGTADLPVAEECLATLRAHGLAPLLLADCGVAGVHRLLASGEELIAAQVVIVIAGMEGALASVVGGLISAPVIAVPTSVGYGAALEGVTALLAMHASCAAGITVVGIDNGYGAACAAARILL